MSNGSQSSTKHAQVEETDAFIIVGGGLAGLVAAHELTKAHCRVIIVDQEPEASLGGQAWWSLGGVFLVDTPEMRRVGIKDSLNLARRDWFNSAAFDKLDTDDRWAALWAEEYLHFVASPDVDGMRNYLHNLGLRFTPGIGWAEKGASSASDHGNSVPRFHMPWGTGPQMVRTFRDPVLDAAKRGLVEFRFRHQVDELVLDDSGTSVVGITGTVLEPSDVERGHASSRKGVGTFSLHGRAVLIATGGIGGSLELIRKMWPSETLGKCPDHFLTGTPAHVDGRMLAIAQSAGANTVNSDRFWFYSEGMKYWEPIWPGHGIRCLSGPSPIWLDATGKRFPPPIFPMNDNNRAFKHILSTGYDYSWFILDQTILLKEFVLSGSDQNPDLTEKSLWLLFKRLMYGPDRVRSFAEHCEDFVVRPTLPELVEGMNELAVNSGRGPTTLLSYDAIESIISDRDAQIDNPYSKDAQLMYINNARLYWPERLSRIAKPHRLLDPAHGPLIAVRMNLITRKTLGGVQTNLSGQVMRKDGETPISGLYAAGELAGFGGGGVMGKNALEGTFVGGCVFSGRIAGRSMSVL